MPNHYKSFIKAMIEDCENNDPINNWTDFKKSSLADLGSLMQSQNVKRLPELYRQFILQMGRGFSGRNDDMLWTVEELLDFYVPDYTLLKLKDDMFIFMWYWVDGYVVYGFHTNDKSDNPSVFTWEEPMSESHMISTSVRLSEFLIGFFAPEEI